MVGIDRIMSEGRALTNCIGNGVATMVIAKLQGERDDERFQAVLNDPSLADPDRVEDSEEPPALAAVRAPGGARAGPGLTLAGRRGRPRRPVAAVYGLVVLSVNVSVLA